ncbi:MAG TPA: hypothetical protein VGN23_04835 [Verrucomicrobiae bacterium]|jgi:hypothetical protein
MKTLTVDAHKRIRLPDAKPKQIFAYENQGNGRLILTVVRAEAQEPFPPGSLSKYLTPKFNREIEVLAKGSSLELPE